jgi:hypothetical protein
MKKKLKATVLPAMNQNTSNLQFEQLVFFKDIEAKQTKKAIENFYIQ